MARFSALDRLLSTGLLSASAFALTFAAFAASNPSKVEAWMTRPEENKPLRPVIGLEFDQAPDVDAYTLKVDLKQRFQTMEGFGANLTESSVINILRLSPEKRERVMHLLFDREKGAGFNFLRVPIGSSEFIDTQLGHYTYNESPNREPDPEMKYFSMERDRKTFEILKQAYLLNPDLSLHLTPWTGPTWMKTNRDFRGGKLKPEYYKDYANYLARVVQEYNKMGLPVHSLSVVNEPGVDYAGFPTMQMNPSEQATLLKSVGSIFRSKSLTTRLLVLDHNWDMVEFVDKLFADQEAKQYADGVAFHCYGGYVAKLGEVLNRYPDKEIYQTECTGDREISKDFKNDLHWWIYNQVIAAANLGAKSGLGWNLVLDENGGPYLEGCSTCRGLVTVDSKTGELKAEAEFYALAHASRAVRRGAVRVAIDESNGQKPGLNRTAFQNPDGSIVILLANSEAQAQSIQVVDSSGQSFRLDLPAHAVLTLKWRPANL